MEPVPSIGSNEPREVAVTKYFIKTPGAPAYLLAGVLATLAAIGAVALLILIGNSPRTGAGALKDCSDCFSILVLGFSVICGCLAVASYMARRNRYLEAWHRAEPKPTDAQIDAWHAADLAKLCSHALEKLDLSPESVAQDNPDGPLVVIGTGPSPMVRAGADRIIRFSTHEVLIIYLTKYHLASYKATTNLIDGLIKSESTQEYHYNDVVSVSTQTDNSGMTWYEDGEKRQVPSFQKFALSVASGEQIAVGIEPNAAEILRGNAMPDSGSDRAIRAIRARLREKKGGTMDGEKGADPSVLG